MNLLKDKLSSEILTKTKSSRKLTINGKTEVYPVYKIHLDVLLYNFANDRIASYVCQYKSENPDKPFTHRENYNSILENYIVQSNPEAHKKTMDNIEKFGQREPGVILADGRIIDGNRRFACLRELIKRNDDFKFFETVILEATRDVKEIKMLELSIQLGEESKVDYNPIDKLVGIYNCIVISKMLTIEEYARSINEKEKDVERRVEIVKLLVEFLEFINAPLQFHIARSLQMYTVFDELETLLQKHHELNNLDEFKSIMFINILMKRDGDFRSFIRKIKNVIQSDYQDAFIREQKAICLDIIEFLHSTTNLDEKFIKDKLRTNDEVINELNASLEKTLSLIKGMKTREKPIKIVEDAAKGLEKIKPITLENLHDSDRKRIKRELRLLEESIQKLKERLED